MTGPVGAELPAFERWRNSFVPGMRSTSAYLEHETSLLSAVLVLELIFPRLTDVQGCVLRADRYEPTNFDQWWAALGGDRTQVELAVNAQPMRYYFDPADEVEQRALGTLAERIALGWRAQAALQFPDRPVTVQVVDGTEDEGPIVLLYCRRSGSAHGAPVPQVQEFERHVDRETGRTYVRAGIVRPAHPDEIEGLR